jgi:hypothetical protein
MASRQDPPITAFDAASPSGLPGAAGGTMDLTGGEAGVRCGELHVDRSKLRGLAEEERTRRMTVSNRNIPL